MWWPAEHELNHVKLGKVNAFLRFFCECCLKRFAFVVSSGTRRFCHIVVENGGCGPALVVARVYH